MSWFSASRKGFLVQISNLLDKWCTWECWVFQEITTLAIVQRKLHFPFSWIPLLDFIIIFLCIVIHLLLRVNVMQGSLQFCRRLRSCCEMGENNLAESPWLSCPLLAGLCLFYTRLFYILSPKASREWWGYMVPSAPTDWLIAQTERESGRGRWRKSTREGETREAWLSE